MKIFDARQCTLGEGAFWHPERKSFFWFDILGQCLLSKADIWQFDECVSAAGWLDQDALFLVSETGFSRLDLKTGARDDLAPLEADNPITRSNDGRADPYGGFWIGTMGKNAEAKAGAIYRYFKGEIRVLFDKITIPNSICFSPDGLWAYFADTVTQQIQRVPMDNQGWPKGDPQVFQDLRAEGLNPDGSVVDTKGQLWNAQWGASRLACYGSEGLRETLSLPTSQVTCPAFGGADLTTLFATTAAVDLDQPHAGKTFWMQTSVTGQAEHKVLL